VNFIAQHTTGIDELLADLDAHFLGRDRGGLGSVAFQISSSPATSTRRRSGVIINYGMGITQHRHGTGNVQQIRQFV